MNAAGASCAPAREPAIFAPPPSSPVRHARLALALALLALLACAAPADHTRRTVRIAAAASLREPVRAVIADLARREPAMRVEPVFTSTGAAVQHIVAGAPYDILVAADTAYPAFLERRALAEPGTRRRIASGRLALWLAPDTPGDGLAALRGARVRRVAIASPEVAPYGRAALRALASAGLAAEVGPRLVYGQDAAQAAQLALAGADAALLPLALVRTPAFAGRGRIVVLDTALAPPVPHEAVIVRGHARPDVRTVYDALVGPAARAAFARAGYEVEP